MDEVQKLKEAAERISFNVDVDDVHAVFIATIAANDFKPGPVLVACAKMLVGITKTVYEDRKVLEDIIELMRREFGK
jgi:hypothetical protein